MLRIISLLAVGLALAAADNDRPKGRADDSDWPQGRADDSDWLPRAADNDWPQGVADYPAGRASNTLTSRKSDSSFQPQFYHDFGKPWLSAMYCPEGSYASGFRQKTDRGCNGGLECTGMNGIELMCSAVGGQKQLGWAKTEIEVPLGLDVNWRSNHWCPDGQFLNSARLLVQPNRGFFQDDDAIEGVEFKCTDGSQVSPDASEMKRRPSDNWLSWSSCPADQVICGVRAAGEWIMFQDNVGLDKLSFFCCKRA